MMKPLARRNDRRATRHAAKLSCQIVRERDFRLVGTKTVDVSADGMRVSTDDYDVRVGDSLLVSFCVTPFGLWFDTEGVVKRVIKGRRPSDKGRRALGISLALSPLKRLILRGAIQKIPPPLPARSQRIDWAASIRQI